jgi:hypothetical protein
MNKLICFVLLALFAHTPTNNHRSLSISIHLHSHAHRASSATVSWLGNRIFLPVAILINTGENLTNQYKLCPPSCNTSNIPSSNLERSTVAMPPYSTASTIFTMPTRSQDAENQRKEEEAMAAATLQWEKEAAAHQWEEDTARTTAVKQTHQQPAVRQVANTPTISLNLRPPPPLPFPCHPPPILTPCSLDMWDKRFREWMPTPP